MLEKSDIEMLEDKHKVNIHIINDGLPWWEPIKCADRHDPCVRYWTHWESGGEIIVLTHPCIHGHMTIEDTGNLNFFLINRFLNWWNRCS